MNKPHMFWGIDNTLNSTDAFENRRGMLSAGMVYTCDNQWRYTVPKCKELFVDSGGFQVTARWDLEYPYSVETLFEYAERVGADYLAAPDYACEPELHDSTVSNRIGMTVEGHAQAMALYEDREWSFQLVPVLQGYEVEDYEHCIDWFESEGMIRDYMAVGTVCKRDRVKSIHNVLQAIKRKLPDVDLHMFGMTLNAWKDRRLWGQFKSADTAAWNWGCGTQEEKKRALKEYEQKINRIETAIAVQSTL